MAEVHPYLVDKPLGATPLEALDALRRARLELKDEKLAYAGRLDPMASGLLVIAHGPWLARQEELWHLPKTYEAQILLGLTTDSYDLLGLAALGRGAALTNQKILAAAQGLVGKLYLSVPVFSSNRAGGKALFEWAREGIPDDVAVPVRRMAVNEVDVDDIGTVAADALLATITQRVGLVKGDFRQSAVMAQWQALLADSASSWPVIHLRIRCGGGTYVRSLAHELGRRLGCGGTLAGLRRTAVGPYTIDDPAVMHTT